MNRITAALARRWLPLRDPVSHKGDFGHVLVVAGSRGMSGAAALASRAALKAGAGLVTAAAPKSVQPIIARQCAELQTLGLPETADGAMAALAAAVVLRAHRSRVYRVLAIGPGVSTRPETGKALFGILARMDVPAVVDADGLNLLARAPKVAARRLLARRRSPCVFTPHPGEAARLLGVSTARVQSDRAGSARRIAREFGVVCLLKGRGTVVSDGKKEWLNTTGNSGLAKGGTGDVLTGVLAALWSQRLGAAGKKADALETAALAAFLHGLSADIAARTTTKYCLMAGDVTDALPAAFRRLLRGRT